MSSSVSSGGGCSCIIYAVLIIFGIGFAIAQPYFEMRTFNKFSNSSQKASYFDAMFAQLRIEARDTGKPVNVNTNDVDRIEE